MASLFARDVQVAVLSSGSKGNCTYVGDGHAGLLIDCGISARQILARMESVGLERAPVDAVLITHEHVDHVGAARVLCDRLRKRQGKVVPFYMTRGTRACLRPACTPDAVELIRSGEAFSVRHFQVQPFQIPHDVAEPVAYRVDVGGTGVGVVTDLGRSTSLVENMVRTLTVAVLEFNHDVDMLLEGPYPWPLKQRIRSSHGHLSNHQACQLLERSMSERLQHLVLAHLSEENNLPARALATAGSMLREMGVEDRVRVQAARQDVALAPIRVRALDW